MLVYAAALKTLNYDWDTLFLVKHQLTGRPEEPEFLGA